MSAAFDDGSAVDDAQVLADAAASDIREIAIFQTGGHGTRMFDENPDLRTRLLDFVAANRS